MNRYRSYTQNDDQPIIVGDSGFATLDMLTDPVLLPPGALAASENIRFDANGATVRSGMQRLLTSGNYIGQVYCAGIYRPNQDQDYLVLVTATALNIFDLGTQTLQTFPFPGSLAIVDGQSVDMVQAGLDSGTLPQLYILLGESATALVYNATAGTLTAATGFPQGDFALYYQNRIVVGQSQQVQVSDFNDFTTFNLLNQFKILTGGDDYLQSVMAYLNDYVLIGSREGWYIAYFDPVIGPVGYTAGLQTNATLQVLTKEAGPVGPRAATTAQGRVWFIAPGAIYAFQPQLNNVLTMLGRPISAPIQPVISRMNTSSAGRATVQHWGYRLYFAMPISDEPVPITAASITIKATPGITLPFDLPTSFMDTAVGMFTTSVPHNLGTEDTVCLAGSPTLGFNGTFEVLSVIDAYNFTVAMLIPSSTVAGTRMTAQRLVTRNNVIAVFNLNTDAWESIDWLPAGVFADWLAIAELNAQRQMLVVDEDIGPLAYEVGEVDQTGGLTGGTYLPLNLTFTLSQPAFESVPVAGRLLTRCFSWNGVVRKVKEVLTRATLDSATTLTQTLYADHPNYAPKRSVRTWTAQDFQTADVPLRQLCGARAIEAQVEIKTTGGLPTIRNVLVETRAVGRVEE